LFYAWPSAIAAYRTDKFQGWVTPVLADDILQALLNWYSLENIHLITAPVTTTQQVTTTTPATTVAPDYTWYIVGIVIIVAAVVVAVAARRKKQR
jgi:uncharacterized membrane protein